MLDALDMLEALIASLCNSYKTQTLAKYALDDRREPKMAVCNTWPTRSLTVRDND